jgi:hypothetical protein
MTDNTHQEKQLARTDEGPGALQRRLELKVKSKLLQVRLNRIEKDIQIIARKLGRGSSDEDEQDA